MSTMFLIIGRNIVILQTNVFSERKQDHNWKCSGQHNSFYYQPHHATDSLYY